MADGWYGNKKGVGVTGGIGWKDKGEVLVSEVNIDGGNIWKPGKMRRGFKFILFWFCLWVELGCMFSHLHF